MYTILILILNLLFIPFFSDSFSNLDSNIFYIFLEHMQISQHEDNLWLVDRWLDVCGNIQNIDVLHTTSSSCISHNGLLLGVWVLGLLHVQRSHFSFARLSQFSPNGSLQNASFQIGLIIRSPNHTFETHSSPQTKRNRSPTQQILTTIPTCYSY